jgi:hypothetical protein
MSLDIIIKIASLLSFTVGVVAFFIGLTNYNKQMNAQVFLQYAKRFDEIMNSFPKNTRLGIFDTEKALPKSSAERRDSAIDLSERRVTFLLTSAGGRPLGVVEESQ